MKYRKLAVVAAVTAVVVVIAISRSNGGDAGAPSSGDAAAVRAAGTSAGASVRRPDPSTLARGSIAGRVTDGGEAPIARARVCADGDSRDLPGELFREPACAETDDQGRYRIGKLLPAQY